MGENETKQGTPVVAHTWLEQGDLATSVAGARDEAEKLRIAMDWASSFPGDQAIAAQAALAVEVLALREAARRQSEEIDRAMALYRQAAHEACTDPLTGLANRRGFQDHAGRLAAQADRYGSTYSVLAIDIDHFKRLNDDHGHDVGDDVLRRVGALLADRVRKPDLAARFGGEEFVILCPNTQSGRAMQLAERVRSAVEAVAEGPAVTISIGVATFEAGDATLDDVLARADRALYRAKGAGRNQVQR